MLGGSLAITGSFWTCQVSAVCEMYPSTWKYQGDTWKNNAEVQVHSEYIGECGLS